MQSKSILLNTNEQWNPKRRYKVNSVVTRNDVMYQNYTGQNTAPELGLDWFIIDADLNNKLDKISTVTENAQAYVKSANGNQTMYNIDKVSLSDSEINIPSSASVSSIANTKLNIADYNDRFKGVFLTLSALNTAFPTANAGDSAQVNQVGSTKVINYSWDAEDNEWVQVGSGGSGATNTDMLPEGTSNLYFTTARVLATLLSGISFATGGAIVSTDSVIVAFGKIQKQINDLGLTYQAVLTNVNFGNFINSLASKTTPVDADSISIIDSADSNKAKKVSFTNLKSTLKDYFDTKYQPVNVVSFIGDTFEVQATGGALSLFGLATPTTVGATMSNLVGNFSAGGYSQSPSNSWNRRSAISATTIGAIAEFYDNTQKHCAVGLGFYFTAKLATSVSTNSAFMVGLSDSNAASTNVNPSTLLNSLFVGFDDTDSNLQIIHNDASGAATKYDLGSLFAINRGSTTIGAKDLVVEIYNIYGSNSVTFHVKNLRTQDEVFYSVSTDTPAITTGLTYRLTTLNRADSSALNCSFSNIKIKRQS